MNGDPPRNVESRVREDDTMTDSRPALGADESTPESASDAAVGAGPKDGSMTIGDGVDGLPYISDPIKERLAMPADPTPTRSPDGIDLITRERQRQIAEEGYTPEHDASHRHSSLAYAAACYAAPDTIYRVETRDLSDRDGEHVELRYFEPWPRTWKRTVNLTPTTDDRVRELVKAGALIAAEIDRLRAVDSSG